MAPSPLVLNGAELTVPDVESVARGRRYAVLDDDARERVTEARAVIERLVASGEVVYGVTTGFGSLASTFVPPERARELQERLLLSHAAGVGTPLPTEVIRAMLLLRANTLALEPRYLPAWVIAKSRLSSQDWPPVLNLALIVPLRRSAFTIFTT